MNQSHRSTSFIHSLALSGQTQQGPVGPHLGGWAGFAEPPPHNVADQRHMETVLDTL